MEHSELLKIPLADLSFCSLDLETTGPGPMSDSIVEVGMIRFTLDGGRSEYSTLVNPMRLIPPDAENIHGISNEMIADAPVIEDVLDHVLNFMDDSVVVIQNPGFDLTFIDAVLRKSEYPPVGLEAIDTVRLSRAAFPLLQNHKLGTVARHLGLDLVLHRALADAEACMNIFRAVIKILDPDSTWKLADLLRLHGPMVGPSGRRFTTCRDKRCSEFKIGKEVRIQYVDSEGNVTDRTIVPKEYIKYGKTFYLSAFCELRGGMRYFRADRITLAEKLPLLREAE